MRVGKIRLLRSTYPRKHIKVGGQPTLILSKQLRDERGRRLRAGPDQVLPCMFGARTPWNVDSALANAQTPAIKIKDGGVGKELPEPNRLLERLPGFGIEA